MCTKKFWKTFFIALNNDFNNILISLLLKKFRDGTIFILLSQKERVFCERIDDIRKLPVERFVLRMGGSQSFKYQPAQSKLWEKKRRACKLSTVRGKQNYERTVVVISAILSGPRARSVENRRVSFSLQFREDFEKDPHVRPVYRSIFQSRGPTPTSFSGLTRGRATGERQVLAAGKKRGGEQVNDGE